MKIIKKISLFFLGLMIAFVFTEISLQTVSFAFKLHKEYKIKQSIKNKTHITVMCIGESTTCGQYPVQLQKYLTENCKTISFNVIDKGLMGVKSINILQCLESWIEKYNPDFVVSMTGINDWKILPWDKSEYSPYIRFFERFKLYKLFYLYLEIFKKTEEINNEKIILNKWDGSKKVIDQAYETDRILKELYHNTGKYMRYMLFSGFYEMDYAVLYEVFLKGNKKNNLDYIIFNREIFYYSDLDTVLEKIKQSDYNDTILGRIAVDYLEKKDDKNSDKYFELAEKYRMKYYNYGTKITYCKIADTVFSRGKQLIAVQYPLRSVQSLKNILKSSQYYDKIKFVSNEELFKKALKANKYDYIFLDRFAGDFGHCTNTGNEMIAENAGKAILDYLKGI